MNIEAYPFLVAKGPTEDFMPVICPSIFKKPYDLINATHINSDTVESNEIIIRKLIAGADVFNLVFKREKIIKPGTLNEVMVEKDGRRPLIAHYGFVTKDELPAIGRENLAGLLSNVKAYNQPYLEKFLSLSKVELVEHKPIRIDLVPLEIEEIEPTQTEITKLADFTFESDVLPREKDNVRKTDPEVSKKKEPENLKKNQEGVSESASKNFLIEKRNEGSLGKEHLTLEKEQLITKVKKFDNAKVVGRIALTVGCCILLYDATIHLIKGIKETDMPENPHLSSVLAKQQKKDIFRGAVESLAAIAGIAFTWKSPLIERQIDRVSNLMSKWFR